jgi:carbohydrate kinase (thermoresistant glucokinase family)
VSLPSEPVLVVMGVSGSGKSTIAGLLAERLGWDIAEGDDLHPAANVEKMADGRPLTDDDRGPWLDAVAAWIGEQVAAGRPGIITCSALKRRYRDRLRGARVVFVYLAAPSALIARRLATRHGHFMPATLLDSQLADLEPPARDEQAITVEVTGNAPELADLIVERLGLRRSGTQDSGAEDSSQDTKPV